MTFPDREMPDADQEPQQHGIDGHRPTLAPTAHEPFQTSRLERVQPAPSLEPGGQDLQGARVAEPEERLGSVDGPCGGAGQEPDDGVPN